MNTKVEFLKHIADRKVLCAEIIKGRYYLDPEDRYNFRLKPNYSEKDYKKFLRSLNFEYDNGYGGQELYGTIWYDDGSWSERGEYEGSEWWEHKKCPEYPSELLAD